MLNEPKDILNACLSTQKQRGSEYNANGGTEDSFGKIATIFNLYTNKDLKPSDIALILQILKDVRQYTNPESLHMDSVIDKPSYAAIQSSLLLKEFGLELPHE